MDQLKKNMRKKNEISTEKPDFLKQAIASRTDIEGIELDTLNTVGDLFVDLLATHWRKIQAIRESSQDSAVTVSLGFDIDTAGARPVVKSKIAYAQKFKDETEAIVEDPDQAKLSLNN